ncbi:MAG: O-antigen ligase family protein [Terriglobales bacterium]
MKLPAQASPWRIAPTTWAKWLVVFIEVMAIVWVVYTEDALWIPIAFAGSIVALLVGSAIAWEWPAGGIVALALAAVMPAWFVQIGNTKLRPEHAAAALVGAFAVVWVVRRRAPIRFFAFDWFLLGYVGVSYLSSAIMSVEPGQTLKWAFQTTLAIAPYFILRVLLRDDHALRQAVRILVAIGVAESLFGLACLLSYRLFGTTFGVFPQQYGNIPGVFGSHMEANLFGAYAACCGLMYMAYFLFGELRDSRHLIGFGICVTGVFISLARAALLAAAVTSVVTLALGFHYRKIDARILIRLVGVVVLAAVLISPLVYGYLEQRVRKTEAISTDLTSIDPEGTTYSRLVQYAVAWGNVKQSPWLGNGVASFQLLFNWSDIGRGEDETSWIGNTLLRVLHDTGVAGTVLFFSFVISLMTAAHGEARRQITGPLPPLLAGALIYLITFQFTEGTILSFTWIHLGLIGAAVALRKEQQPDKAR